MQRYEKRYWVLAAGVAGLAGFCDALGFLKLGGFFVSFMSGNSTRLAVGLAGDEAAALIAAEVIVTFLAGVMSGAIVAILAEKRQKPAILLAVSLFLAIAAVLNGSDDGRWPALTIAFAMGAANAVFLRDGEVSIGVTYMTGTLVKFGQRLVGAVMGGDRWGWVPYLILWMSLVVGATVGALSLPRFGAGTIWWATSFAIALAIYSWVIDDISARTRFRGTHHG